MDAQQYQWVNVFCTIHAALCTDVVMGQTKPNQQLIDNDIAALKNDTIPPRVQQVFAYLTHALQLTSEMLQIRAKLFIIQHLIQSPSEVRSLDVPPTSEVPPKYIYITTQTQSYQCQKDEHTSVNCIHCRKACDVRANYPYLIGRSGRRGTKELKTYEEACGIPDTRSDNIQTFIQKMVAMKRKNCKQPTFHLETGKLYMYATDMEHSCGMIRRTQKSEYEWQYDYHVHRDAQAIYEGSA